MRNVEVDRVEVLLLANGTLLSGGLAALLAAADGVDLTTEVAFGEEMQAVVSRCRPDVVVLDIDLLGADPYPMMFRLLQAAPECRLLMLMDGRRSGLLGRALPTRAPRVGFLAKEAPPGRLIEGIRRMARGEQFLDPGLAVAALAAQQPPLTPRERDVLVVAAEGATVKEIAAKLCLSEGTVRNYLSQILNKTGARTRIEAVRIAYDTGWI